MKPEKLAGLIKFGSLPAALKHVIKVLTVQHDRVHAKLIKKVVR